MGREIILPGGDKLQLFDSKYTAAEIESRLTCFSTPQLLDNADFRDPINQRGETEYGPTGYCIDRWKIISDWGKVALGDGCLHILSNDVNGYGGIRQDIDESVRNGLMGKQITFSVLMRPYTMMQLSGDTAKDYGRELCLASVTFTWSEQDSFVQVRAFTPVTPGGKIADIYAAKLELGDTQTLAHQDSGGNWVLNDPPPNKALELEKCQRYQLVYGEDSSLVMNATTTTSLAGSCNYPVSMRVKTSELNFVDLRFRNMGTGEILTPTIATVFGSKTGVMSIYNVAGVQFTQGAHYQILGIIDCNL